MTLRIKFIGQILLFFSGLSNIFLGILSSFISNVTKLVLHSGIVFQRFLQLLDGILWLFLCHIHEALDHAKLFIKIFLNAQFLLGITKFLARLGNGLFVIGFKIPEMLGQEIKRLGHLAMLLGGFLEGFFLLGGITGLNSLLQSFLGGINRFANQFTSRIAVSSTFATFLVGHVLCIGITLQCTLNTFQAAIEFLLFS